MRSHDSRVSKCLKQSTWCERVTHRLSSMFATFFRGVFSVFEHVVWRPFQCFSVWLCYYYQLQDHGISQRSRSWWWHHALVWDIPCMEVVQQCQTLKMLPTRCVPNTVATPLQRNCSVVGVGKPQPFTYLSDVIGRCHNFVYVALFSCPATSIGKQCWMLSVLSSDRLDLSMDLYVCTCILCICMHLNI